ncbi:MAG TPA: zinc-ribbon domain-containing protein [Thermoplasmata archaeon]|nr:zinc-ribbon domain-containing protein [Thermoplasmata archaeon]
MYCSRCGARNDEDAKFCEKCGADLATMPRPSVTGAPPRAPVGPPLPPMPPMVYPPARPHLWWYPIGVWVILAGFFAFIDVATTHAITWSIWPIGILGIFMVGFPLLHLVEERAGRPR